MMHLSIPVLMYHAVTDKAVNPGIHRVHITINMFKQQMEWLYMHGYVSVNITEMLEMLKTGIVTPKSFVLTFDDGYGSLLELVSPVLSQYGFKATLFLTTAPVGHKNFDILPEYDTSYPPDDRPLTWDELRIMEGNGWDIEAHGHNHIANNMIPYTFLYREMQDSIDKIREHLDKEVSYYAYPYGRYNTSSLKMLPKAGLKAAFSVHPGLTTNASDLRRLPRIEINRDDTMETFQRKVETGYLNTKERLKTTMLRETLYRNTYIKDWIKIVQDKLKHTKHRINLMESLNEN